MSSSSFSPSVLTLPATSQQLELNIVTNPTAATSPTDKWTVSGMSVTRDATGSPLDPLVPTGFNMSSTANGQTFTTVALTVPSTLMNKKLKVEFYYTYVSGTSFTLDVLDGADVHYNLTTDVSGTTTLPQTSGKFTAYFDSNNTTSLKVRFSSTGTGVTKFTQLIVGPGIQPQGGAIDQWLSFTPVLKAVTTNPSLGSTGTAKGKYRRVGSCVEIDTFFNFSGSGINYGSGSYYLDLAPLGLTIDENANPENVGADASLSKGIGYVSTNSGASRFTITADVGVNANSQRVYWLKISSTPIGSTDMSGAPSIFAAGIILPVAQWATSGTVNVAQNDVEYAYNTDTSASTNTTAFGYGPTGVLFPNITTNTSVSKTVQFQTPIQVGDDIVLEYYDPTSTTNTWQALSQRMPYIAQGALSYGVTVSPSTSNRVLINFQGGGATTTNTTYAANGQLFSAYFSVNWKWRVRKSSAGSAVGFGIVQGTSAGLVPASNTNFDDVTATRLGLKQYLHGTTYNGGIAPTVTLNAGGGSLSSVTRAVFIPYQVQDGTWRLKFNVAVLLDAIARTQVSIAVNGITSKNAGTQSISAHGNNSTAYVAIQGIDANTNIFNWYGASTAATSYRFSGDIELESKPTWAY